MTYELFTYVSTLFAAYESCISQSLSTAVWRRVRRFGDLGCLRENVPLLDELRPLHLSGNGQLSNICP
jgi:hypothetical protein